MKPFNIGDIAIGQNFVHYPHLNGVECEIIGGLQERNGLFHDGISRTEYMYAVRWSNGEEVLVSPRNLRRKPSRSDDAWSAAKLALLVTLATAAPLANAGEFWGVVNLASKHIGESKPLNERNPGLGIEYAQSQDVTYMAGAYRNSHNRRSLYGFAAYTPVQYDGFSFGVAAGAASGYTSGRETKTLPVLAGLVRWRGDNFGVNVLVIPKSKNANVTFGLQAVFKF